LADHTLTAASNASTAALNTLTAASKPQQQPHAWTAASPLDTSTAEALEGRGLERDRGLKEDRGRQTVQMHLGASSAAYTAI
jgi:hypothetical protein